MLSYRGPLTLLDRFAIAVVASDLIPAQAMLATNQLLLTVQEYSLTYIGGWHSVMETEIFRIALDRRNDSHQIRPLLLFSARGLNHESWEGFLAERFGDKGPFTGFPEKAEYLRRAQCGELLILSLAKPSLRKMTRANIMARNLAACALADVVFIPFAEKGTKTYALSKRVLKKRIPIFATECPENGDLVELGIPTFNRKSVGEFLQKLGAWSAASRHCLHPSLRTRRLPPPRNRNRNQRVGGKENCLRRIRAECVRAEERLTLDDLLAETRLLKLHTPSESSAMIRGDRDAR